MAKQRLVLERYIFGWRHCTSVCVNIILKKNQESNPGQSWPRDDHNTVRFEEVLRVVDLRETAVAIIK